MINTDENRRSYTLLPRKPEPTNEREQNQACLYYAERGGGRGSQPRDAGFAGIDSNHIAGLFVDENYQSQGIGTSLIEFIKQHHFTLTLAVYKKNEKAQQFYSKHGFVVTEERIDTKTDEAELLMRWNRACPI